MAIRTKEQLKQLFQERKEIKQRQLQREKEKYRAKVEKPQPEQNKPSNFNYSLTIYHTTTVERYSSDEDLYQTREELDQDGSGEINWNKWNELVNKLRKEFKQHGRRLPHTGEKEKN